MPAGAHSIMHVGVVESGEVQAGQTAHASIDRDRREATARSHTSTHVVHWTLKHILGDHARQAGSLVAPGRLRFDFPHHAAVPPETLEQAELEANRRLAQDDSIHIFETSMSEAEALGATMLFGEKYGDVVRVVEIGDYSRELCGGTHVDRTGNVAIIRILGEASIGAGMRRVEALVGPDALREINAERELLRGLVEALGSQDARLGHRTRSPDRGREQATEGRVGAPPCRRSGCGDRLARRRRGAGRRCVARGLRRCPARTRPDLRDLAQKVRDRLSGGPAVVVVGNGEGGKAMIVAAVSPPAVERGITAPACSRSLQV